MFEINKVEINWAGKKLGADEKVIDYQFEKIPEPDYFGGSLSRDLLGFAVPYFGVSKLAGEHLFQAYYRTLGLPITILRYFTVYGPRQRPDMAFNRFIELINKNQEIEIFGDGQQIRSFTYIEDVVKATIRSAQADCIGEIINIGNNDTISLKDSIRIIEELIEKQI